MRALRLLRGGISRARRHPILVVLIYLTPLLPAALLAGMAASSVIPTFDQSLFSQRILEGEWFGVWRDFRLRANTALVPPLAHGLVLLGLAMVLAQTALSAGVVEVLVGRQASNPFLAGIRRNFWCFVRSGVFHSVGVAVVVVAVALVVKGGFRLARDLDDARFDALGFALAGLVGFLLWAPLSLAHDLSRIAAVHHQERSMFRGLLRGLKAVLFRPMLLLPLALAFVLLPAAVHLVYYAARSPWTPGGAAAVALLLLIQQSVMVVRAFVKLSVWGAEVTAFEFLDAPRLCRLRQRRSQPEAEAAADTQAQASDPEPRPEQAMEAGDASS